MGIESFSVADEGAATGEANEKITTSVVITCLIASLNGLMFGYDMGISGGVTSMLPFLEQFFPSILHNAASAGTYTYCMYNDQLLTLFTSSLSLAGLVSALVGSRLTKLIGRKNLIMLGGFLFLVGATLHATANSIGMLILGRVFLGIGIGFSIMTAPVYISEMAPPKWRGSFVSALQYFTGIGNISAIVLAFLTTNHSWGWHVALGFCVVPGTIMTLGALFIPDTPTSLVERGMLGEAHVTLIKIRGSDLDVDEELSDLIRSSDFSKANQDRDEKYITILERQYRPQLVMSITLPFFSHITGINIIGFYAPPLFRALGFGIGSALTATILLAIVGLCATLVPTLMVDRCGRRLLYIIGGILMFVCQVLVAGLLAISTGPSGDKTMSKGYAELVLALLGVFCAAFQISWGTLTPLVVSEIFPMRIKSTGQSMVLVAVSITTFVISQTFMSMLCHLKFGIFLFHAVWLAVMTTFVMYFLPETKGIPLNSMHQIWEKHWYWSRFVQPENDPLISSKKKHDRSCL